MNSFPTQKKREKKRGAADNARPEAAESSDGAGGDVVEWNDSNESGGLLGAGSVSIQHMNCTQRRQKEKRKRKEKKTRETYRQAGACRKLSSLFWHLPSRF